MSFLFLFALSFSFYFMDVSYEVHTTNYFISYSRYLLHALRKSPIIDSTLSICRTVFESLRYSQTFDSLALFSMYRCIVYFHRNIMRAQTHKFRLAVFNFNVTVTESYANMCQYQRQYSSRKICRWASVIYRRLTYEWENKYLCNTNEKCNEAKQSRSKITRLVDFATRCDDVLH